MDAVEVARLRALADKATPGPWVRVEMLHAESGVAVEGFERTRILARVAPVGSSYGKDDAEFIAAAREAVPALLDALEQTQEQLEQAQAKLAAVRRDFADEDSIAMWLDAVCSEPEVVAASLCRIDSIRALAGGSAATPNTNN